MGRITEDRLGAPEATVEHFKGWRRVGDVVRLTVLQKSGGLACM